MSEKRFTRAEDSNGLKSIFDNEIENGKPILVNCIGEVGKVVDLLNEQQSTIITLKRRLEKINGGYGHLTHRNGLTANEWVIESQERELQKKNEQISDWIEQHSKDIEKISEQQATIQFLQNEIDELKKDIDIYKYEEKKHSETARKLYEENEQLKKRLEHYKEVEAMNEEEKNE